MKKLTILTIAVLISIAAYKEITKEVYEVEVTSVVFGDKVVRVSFPTKAGQLIRVSGNQYHGYDGFEYDPKDVIQHTGHLATVK